MKELGDALKSIFDKLGQFLDLFDLSFLISGAVTTGAVAFWCHESGYSLSFPLDGWLSVIALFLTFYIAGLVSFALGRWPRTGAKNATNSFDSLFERILKAHGLADDPTFKEYLLRTNERGSWRLYVRLWAEVRACPSAAPSLTLLNRYWVMAATYDGLFVAGALWALVLASRTYWPEDHLDYVPGSLLVAVVALASYACFREAGRYLRYQVEELVAAIATEKGRK
jgi:hypothetical protein